MGKKIIFVFLICIGIFFRVYAIEQIPGGLFGDEVSLAVNTKTIAQNGTDEYGRKYPFGFESFSDYKMPGYVYASVVAFKIFGPRIISIRLIAMLSSIISIFLIGYLAKLLFPKSKKLPFYTMILLALSPYHIHFGRIAYETMLATTLLLGFFIAFIQSILSNKRILWFCIGAVLLFASCWTYPAPRFIIPTFLLLVLLAGYIIKPKDYPFKNILSSGLGYIFLALLSFIPSILNPAMEKRPLGYLFPQGNNSSFMGYLVNKITHIIPSYLRSFNFEFLFDKGDIFAFRSGTKLAGLFFPIFTPFFITGIFTFVKTYTRKEFAWTLLGILLIVCALPSSLTWDVPYGPRFLPMIIPLVLLVGLGWEAVETYLSRKKMLVRRIAYILSVGLLSFQILWFADIYFIRFPILSQPEFVSATQELGTYLKQQRATNSSKTIYFLEGKSCASWRYDDLHFWYSADLPNAPMISWDNAFRILRDRSGNPFDAYDFLVHPTQRFDHIVLYPTTEEMAHAPEGSILVHCGITLKDLNPNHEHIEKIFYLYEETMQNPEYIVTKKK